jgi:hypothetical protein
MKSEIYHWMTLGRRAGDRYNAIMAANRYLPDSNRLSVLTAAVLLAFALTRFIQAPDYTLQLQLPGFYFAINLDLNTITTILAAGLTATGMDWMLRGHPALRDNRTIEHWILPTLTTFVIGIPLTLLPGGGLWWLGFGVGGVLLVLVFLAEYIVVEPADSYYPTATAGLTALSFAMYLILAVALRYAGARLFLVVPALLLAAFFVSLRTLHLRLSSRWQFAWAAGIALASVQLAAGLHYWPVSPVRYGLLLLGPLYALTSLAAGLGEGNSLRRAAVEPAVMLGLVWSVVIWVR